MKELKDIELNLPIFKQESNRSCLTAEDITQEHLKEYGIVVPLNMLSLSLREEMAKKINNAKNFELDQTAEIESATFQVNLYNEQIGYLHKIDDIECDKCNNKGYISFLDLEPYPCNILKECDCQKLRRIHTELMKSGLREYSRYTLEDFKIESMEDKKLGAYLKNSVQEYIDKDNNDWFAILGQSGVGKTMLCSIICNHLIKKKRKPVLRIIWDKYLEEIRRSFNNNELKLKKKVLSEDEEGELFNPRKKYEEIEILYIDDLFKNEPNNFSKNEAVQLINLRYNNNLKTIISSEFSFKQLKDLDLSMTGRIYEMTKNNIIQIEKDEKRNYRFKGENIL